jgi:hypothetical protein
MFSLLYRPVLRHAKRVREKLILRNLNQLRRQHPADIRRAIVVTGHVYRTLNAEPDSGCFLASLKESSRVFQSAYRYGL